MSLSLAGCEWWLCFVALFTPTLVVTLGQAQDTDSTSPNVCSSVLRLLLGWLVDEPVWLYRSSAGSLARCSHLESAALSVQPGLQCSYPYFWSWVRSS